MKVDKVVAGLLAGAVGAQLMRLGIPGRYRPLYEAAGARHGVDPNMLHAIALWEARGSENATAVSPQNNNGSRDYGLMQISSSNFAWLGVTATSVMDPATNVDCAARILKGARDLAPHLNVLDEFSVYNGGFSQHRDPQGRRRPKLTPEGVYINVPYVVGAASWYALIAIADLAPIKRLGWPVAPTPGGTG